MLGFPQIDSSPGESGAVELDFRRASFPPGESCTEDCDYIRPAWLAGSSVCMQTVTLQISPQSCTELSPLGGSLCSVD